MESANLRKSEVTLMNEKQAYEHLSGRIGIKPELVPFLVEITLDQTVLNPVLSETVRNLSRTLDLRPGHRVLDLACGKAGVSLPLVHTYKVNLTGIDLMPDFIREAWSRAEYSGLYHLCDFRLDDAARFAAQTKAQWDAVLIVGALTIIWEDFETGLEAVLPLVRPGGHLVIGHPYLLPQGDQDPDHPLMAKDETTARLGRLGQIAGVFDDGLEGWKHMLEPQKKQINRLKEKNEDNPELLDFLDTWDKRSHWEHDNLGFAVWVVKIS